MLAIINCSRHRLIAVSGGSWLRVLTLVLTISCGGLGQTHAGGNGPASFRVYSQEKYLAAQKKYRAAPQEDEASWRFAHACFDRANYATNDTERAALANQGITVCRKLVARNLKSAQGHQYLGMNLGQLARTKLLGALKIVDEMEREFKMARALDEKLDYAGPDRNLGLLYLNAPSFGSIGSRSKAKQHLQKAVEIAPEYPENHLNLIEAHLKWRDYIIAKRQLKALETIIPEAREEFTGPDWSPDWTDWRIRLAEAREKIEENTKSSGLPRDRF